MFARAPIPRIAAGSGSARCRGSRGSIRCARRDGNRLHRDFNIARRRGAIELCAEDRADRNRRRPETPAAVPRTRVPAAMVSRRGRRRAGAEARAMTRTAKAGAGMVHAGRRAGQCRCGQGGESGKDTAGEHQSQSAERASKSGAAAGGCSKPLLHNKAPFFAIAIAAISESLFRYDKVSAGTLRSNIGIYKKVLDLAAIGSSRPLARRQLAVRGSRDYRRLIVSRIVLVRPRSSTTASSCVPAGADHSSALPTRRAPRNAPSAYQ